MKVLLVYPPARDASVFPLGLAYIASYLRKNGHEVELLDFTVRQLSGAELSAEIKQFNKYDCIGISAIITAYNFVKEFSKHVKSHFPNLPVVVGNAISIACPATLLKNSDVDIVVADEGELTASELINSIKEPGKFKYIKGIWYKENGQIHQTPPRERIKNLDSLPYPSWNLIDMPFYMKHAGAYLERGLRTGWVSPVRGCPFSCGFCSRPFAQTITYRSPNSIIDEILEFKRIYNNTHVKLVADEFMVNIDMVKNFAKSLLERKIKITWEANGRVNFADIDLFRLMRKSGCISLSYGIESGSQKILNNMNKMATVEQSRKAIELTRKAGITARTPFMFGYIGEDKATIADTVNFIKQAKLGVTRLFFTTPYPGTALYNWALQNNRIKYEEDVYLSLLGNNAEKFLVNLTDMPDEELVRLKAETESELRKLLGLKMKIKYGLKRINYIKAKISQLGVAGTFKKAVNKLFGFKKHV